jgi:hypothetical protein
MASLGSFGGVLWWQSHLSKIRRAKSNQIASPVETPFGHL